MISETQRKERGAKSAVIVERLVRMQLRAMGCERFDVGIKRDAGEMILWEGQGALDNEATIKWLRHENAKRAQRCGVIRQDACHPGIALDSIQFFLHLTGMNLALLRLCLVMFDILRGTMSFRSDANELTVANRDGGMKNGVITKLALIGPSRLLSASR